MAAPYVVADDMFAVMTPNHLLFDDGAADLAMMPAGPVMRSMVLRLVVIAGASHGRRGSKRCARHHRDTGENQKEFSHA
jgi:hypothetical protein